MTDVNDVQWELVESLLPKSKRPEKGGRPRVDNRKVLNGILWVFGTGSQWSSLPQRYGSYVTCWRRYREWEKSGLWEKIWISLLKSFNRKQQMEWMLALIDGNFVPSKRDSGGE